MKAQKKFNNNQINDLNNRNTFIRDAMPDSWLSYAEDLERAAELLWLDKDNGLIIEADSRNDGSTEINRLSDHPRSYILLASLSIENVLKGLLIANDPKLIANGYLGRSICNHNLIDLANRVNGLKLSKCEKNVLKICQDAIPYWGRYPVPLRYEGLKPKEAANNEFHSCFRDFHYRLCKRLYESVKDGWDSGNGAQLIKIRNARYDDKDYNK